MLEMSVELALAGSGAIGGFIYALAVRVSGGQTGGR
jgi:hypothetical protein